MRAWLRGPDSNRQPSDYEPDELPIAPPRDGWWRGQDSNLRRLRRQIYSLLPLATWVPLRAFQLSTYRGTLPDRPDLFRPVPPPAQCGSRHNINIGPSASSRVKCASPKPFSKRTAGAGDGTRTHNLPLTRRLL